MTNENLTLVLISGVSCYERDGTAYLRLEDVARGLGFTQTQNKNGVEYTSIRWETINRYLEEIGFPNKLGKDSYIPENIFYRLAMKAKNETAEKFQALVADEIIPSIRKTGSYSIVQADPNLPPELAMVEGLLNSMKQMYSTQQRHDKAIEQLTESMDTMKEVMTTDVNGDWRTACGHAIQAVARKLGGGKAYEEVHRNGAQWLLRSPPSGESQKERRCAGHVPYLRPQAQCAGYHCGQQGQKAHVCVYQRHQEAGCGTQCPYGQAERASRCRGSARADRV